MKARVKATGEIIELCAFEYDEDGNEYYRDELELKSTTSYRVKKFNYVLMGKGFSRIKNFPHDYEYIYRPYLFPLSSMTEEQKNEFDQLIELELKAINDEISHTQATAFEIDFYNKHHLDWRGLIEKSIALDATGLNIYSNYGKD